MIIFYFFLIILLASILGYSYLLKFLFSAKIDVHYKFLYPNDLINGIFLIISLLLFLHFFFPIKYLLFIIPLGFFIFIICFFKKLIKIDFIKSKLLIIFILIFISASNGPLYDTQLYHHQILNWNYNYKISLNLFLIEDRFGMVSPWHLFLSLGNFKISNSYIANLFNFIPLLILLFENLYAFKDKLKISNLFLILSTLFILTYGLIHPFQNGAMLMSLGSLGTDLAGLIFYLLSFYYFFKTIETKKLQFYYLNLICVVLVIFCRLSYLPLIFLPLILIFNKKIFLQTLRFNFFIIFIFILWMVRSFLNNGCLIFPIAHTCFDFFSNNTFTEVKDYSYVVKSFARTAPEYVGFMNLDYSIFSYKWLMPWLQSYFLKSSLSQISFIISFIALPFFIYSFIFKNKDMHIKFFCLFIFIINFILWLEAPDLRFAFGLFVSFPVFLIIYSLSKNFNFFFKNVKSVFFVLLLLIVLKNFKNINYMDTSGYLIRNYNYDKFKVIKKIENFTIKKNYSNGAFCYDIGEICIINDNINFNLSKNNFGYIRFFE